MRWTEEQLREYQTKKDASSRLVATTVPTATPRQVSLIDPYRSKLENRYAAHLQNQLLAGEISAWRYEPQKFRLAKATFYTPDFLIVRYASPEDTPHFMFSYDEVKGTWSRQQSEKSRVKLKVAAEMYPWFLWRGVTYQQDRWQYEKIGAKISW